VSPIRLCLEPHCALPAEVRGRCRVHATEARRANRSVNDAFYSSKGWRMARRAFLAANPLCQYVVDDHGTQCGHLASDVHHIIAIEAGGSKRDPSNFRSLCRAHHSMTHRRTTS
jgi:5-methylcytosine-specific restriction endonuclease McrA